MIRNRFLCDNQEKRCGVTAIPYRDAESRNRGRWVSAGGFPHPRTFWTPHHCAGWRGESFRATMWRPSHTALRRGIQEYRLSFQAWPGIQEIFGREYLTILPHILDLASPCGV